MPPGLGFRSQGTGEGGICAAWELGGAGRAWILARIAVLVKKSNGTISPLKLDSSSLHLVFVWKGGELEVHLMMQNSALLCLHLACNEVYWDRGYLLLSLQDTLILSDLLVWMLLNWFWSMWASFSKTRLFELLKYSGACWLGEHWGDLTGSSVCRSDRWEEGRQWGPGALAAPVWECQSLRSIACCQVPSPELL